MLTIIKPGLLTTVQDLGRIGYQKDGVPESGAMDRDSVLFANWLVVNSGAEAVLEMTINGPVIQIENNTVLAITGGDCSPTINGYKIGMHRPVVVKKGSVLSLGSCKTGCRSYLSIAGGVSVPKVLNSRSTYLIGKMGGMAGRALKAGDQFPVQNQLMASDTEEWVKKRLGTSNFKELPWSISNCLITVTSLHEPICVIKGRHANLFTKASLTSFFSSAYQITPQSDRMGYRLKGASLHTEEKVEILSEAVAFGTIQVPSGGDPIILMADRQTIGGYPKLGEVATIDIPRLAQGKPSDKIRFKEISLQEAQDMFAAKHRKFNELRVGIALKWREEKK